MLNERIELSRRIAERSRIAGREHGFRYWEGVPADAEKQADASRRVQPGAAEAGNFRSDRELPNSCRRRRR